MNVQEGPDPGPLQDVVDACTYKPGWTIYLRTMPRPTEHHAGSHGLTLIIAADVPDSTTDGTTNVEHWFAIPTCQYDRPTWERWVLDCLILVETHEAMEFYRVDGRAPFFPAHGPGQNPYEIRRTSAPT